MKNKTSRGSTHIQKTRCCPARVTFIFLLLLLSGCGVKGVEFRKWFGFKAENKQGDTLTQNDPWPIVIASVAPVLGLGILATTVVLRRIKTHCYLEQKPEWEKRRACKTE